jgi:hypothetical protein
LPGQAGFFRCLARKSRPPWDFRNPEWCYLPDGGPDFCPDVSLEKAGGQLFPAPGRL